MLKLHYRETDREGGREGALTNRSHKTEMYSPLRQCNACSEPMEGDVSSDSAHSTNNVIELLLGLTCRHNSETALDCSGTRER